VPWNQMREECQMIKPDGKGQFQLFRIGVAASARHIHPAIYDPLRRVKDR